ncbi:adenylyl cyclase [Buttiauxella ferragutiae ATCC 51602]|uniref:diguanylate cyclase n=1 Tax=Buttiauxella ferragutiae ATCC 51602 TaxID=1354252 RepID=A0ABX2W8C0_9ENTR|nr:diguanylate cyclase [Buttiauxella ferragutiae]OAT27811.1 adenylyl cyclase [Buttiauxella ferragutiae ATCC 51602]
MSTSRANRFRLPLANTLRVIHLCFIFVFVLTAILFWQQGQLFSQGYRTGQLSHLESVIARLESRAQYKVDNLRYLKRIFIEAMDDPIFPGSPVAPWEVNENAIQRPLWIGELPLPDTVTEDEAFQGKESQEVRNQLNGLRKIQGLFPLATGEHELLADLYYISREGEFIASLSQEVNEQLINSYNPHEKQGSFVLASPLLNPRRAPFWTRQNIANSDETVINAAIPVDFGGEWVGLLGIAFDNQSVQKFLASSLPEGTQSAYRLYDEQLKPLTKAVGAENNVQLNVEQKKTILKMLIDKPRGTFRSGSVFITFGKLRGTHSVLVSTQTLSQGLHEDFGRFSLLLVTMFLIFVLSLLGAHRIICRLVGNMGNLQREMQHHALHDDLTGVLNRRGFFEKTSQVSPNYVDYTLVLLDLDHFKKVNDMDGHQVGDNVLIHATGRIQRAIRKQDILGRIGGEEFCIYLPNSDLKTGIMVATRIKWELESSALILEDGSQLPVTASLGVASYREHPEYMLEQIQSLADMRMYRAKARGRNQVCWLGEDKFQA